MATHTSGSGNNHAEPERAGDRLPAAVIDDILDSPRRRTLIAAVFKADEPVPVDDLAEVLVQSDGNAAPASTAERRDVRTEIYQEHLPKLTATGVVEFDSVLGTVCFTGSEPIVTRLNTGQTDRRGTKDK